MKKILLTMFLIVLSLSSVSFGAKDDHYKNRMEKQKAYDKISSKYEKKIEDLNKKLSKKNEELDKAKSQKKPDNKKINEITGERDKIKSELESVHSDFRKDLSKNKLSDF